MPAGQQLVRVTLVADVPKQPIVGEIKHPVQGDGQLGDAQIAGQVAAVSTDHVDDPLADFIRELGKRLGRHGPQVGRRVDLIE